MAISSLSFYKIKSYFRIFRHVSWLTQGSCCVVYHSETEDYPTAANQYSDRRVGLDCIIGSSSTFVFSRKSFIHGLFKIYSITKPPYIKSVQRLM
jgi:hypothetical protein